MCVRTAWCDTGAWAGLLMLWQLRLIVHEKVALFMTHSLPSAYLQRTFPFKTLSVCIISRFSLRSVEAWDSTPIKLMMIYSSQPLTASKNMCCYRFNKIQRATIFFVRFGFVRPNSHAWFSLLLGEALVRFMSLLQCLSQHIWPSRKEHGTSSMFSTSAEEELDRERVDSRSRCLWALLRTSDLEEYR